MNTLHRIKKWFKHAITAYIASEQLHGSWKTFVIAWVLVGVVGWIIASSIPLTTDGKAYLALVTGFFSYVGAISAEQAICRIRLT